MTTTTPFGATLPGVTHHLADVNGTQLHYVSAGTDGSPILLVHGWPETWWAFRKLIPLLARTHRVFALDLRGFGDSSNADTEYGEVVAAEDLHHLVEHIGAGPVHILCQDISGGTGFRFAATHPEDVISFTGIETALAGFGFEALADVNNHGSWHVGFLGAPGIPGMLLPGHERELLADWAFPLMNRTEDSIGKATSTSSFEATRARTPGEARRVFTEAFSPTEARPRLWPSRTRSRCRYSPSRAPVMEGSPR